VLAWQQPAAPPAGLHACPASLAPGERPTPDGGTRGAQTRTPCPACRTTRSATATGTPCRCRTSPPTSRRARRTRSRPRQPWRAPAQRGLPAAWTVGGEVVTRAGATSARVAERPAMLADMCQSHCCFCSLVMWRCRPSECGQLFGVLQCLVPPVRCAAAGQRSTLKGLWGLVNAEGVQLACQLSARRTAGCHHGPHPGRAGGAHPTGHASPRPILHAA